MVKRSKPDLKSGVPARVSRVRIPLAPPPFDDDNLHTSACAHAPRKTPGRGLHPPIHPPTSPRDPVADVFGVSAGELVAIVRRMVRRASGGVTHDLDDAVQETLCRVLAIDAYRFDSTRAVEGFVAMRARWTLRDMRRRESRRGRLDAVDLARSVEPMAPCPLDGATPDLTPHLARLSVADRALLMVHDVDGVSLTLLARQWGVSVATLSRQRSSALAILRSHAWQSATVSILHVDA